MSDISVSGMKSCLVDIGDRCSIGSGVQIIFAGKGSVKIGDYVTLGDNVKMVVEGGDVLIGDWTTLHSHTTVFSKAGVSIGAHCWFGQNAVIDGTGGLTIENGVRVGMFSQIWTHVAAGEQIEGCTLFGETPTHIEADVWLVGTCTVGSGVRIGHRTIALAGSNVTRNCPSNVVVAGAPARVKEGLSFYRDISLDEKFALLARWLSQAPFALSDDAALTVEDTRITVAIDRSRVVFFKLSEDFDAALAHPAGDTTFCCVETKRYTKQLTTAERAVLKYLSGNKARFYAI